MSDSVLSASLEDYLEAIYNISLEKHAARAKDIANSMKVKASSVTGALRQLAERNLVNYAPYDLITLTKQGEILASEVASKHKVLKDFFTNVLSVAPEEAEHAACQMEHAVTKDILERFTKFVQFVEECPRAGTTWINGFGYYCTDKRDLDDCERCTTKILDTIKEKKEVGEQMTKDLVRLNEVKPGSRVRITAFRMTGPVAIRFQEMGLTIGSIVTVERVAPLGDPVEIKVKGYSISLRKSELRFIEAVIEDN